MSKEPASEHNTIRRVAPSETGSSRDDHWLQEIWYKGWKVHRDDGPAIIYKNGTKMYYLEGKTSRKNGPALIVPHEVARRGNGVIEGWYQDGVQHRIGGPAIIRLDGTEIYFEYGRKIKTVHPDGSEELA